MGETLIQERRLRPCTVPKTTGGNRVRVFADRMNARRVAQLTLENDLRAALEAGEFFLVYQPQMEMATGNHHGIEALLRWQHPVLGLVPPDRFIRLPRRAA